jgi:hypothetical protein
MLFAKPLHLTAEEVRLSEVKWSEFKHVVLFMVGTELLYII